MKARKRISVIVGHYGSGKTEISVNMAIQFKKRYNRVAILDLDITNPYFRSRERQNKLEALGIGVYFNTYEFDIGENLPAVGAIVKAPLEDGETYTVCDAGGNDCGARLLKQFDKFFDYSDILCVINANRPDTRDLAGCLQMIEELQIEIGRKITGIINNTHMLRDTAPADVVKGDALCREIEKVSGIPFLYSTAPEQVVEKMSKEGLLESVGPVEKLTLQMRPTWLDK